MIAIRNSNEIVNCTRTVDGGLALWIPAHWKPSPSMNPHAAQVEVGVIEWFHELGFNEQACEAVRRLAPGHYAGAPFPHARARELTCLAKYLSLWHLWDCVEVETSGRGFRVRTSEVFNRNANPSGSLLDKAWCHLLRELAQSHGPAWIEALICKMHVWNAAALTAGRVAKSRRERHVPVPFAEAQRLRAATTGMEVVAHLIEHVRRVEVPKEFHSHPTTRKLKTLAGQLVSCGSDLFSVGKDLIYGHINVILAIQDALALSLPEAARRIAKMFNDAILEFDHHARLLPSVGGAIDASALEWSRDLRHACVGFMLWESRSPKYADFKLLVDGTPLEAYFVFPTNSSVQTRIQNTNALSGIRARDTNTPSLSDLPYIRVDQ